MEKMFNIVIPMAGGGKPFQNAGYAFPKPLIDIKGKTMIEVVVNNLRPRTDHKFIFVCRKELQEKYDLYNILKNATANKFEIVPISGATQGAACTVLCAAQHINTDEELVIANSDQYIEFDVNDFIADARARNKDGLIMTFHASHPKWSYARVDSSGKVLETAEKRVISNNATAGIYYFRKGSDFVEAAQSMIRKNIRYNNEFYVCPAYNELILQNKNIYARDTAAEKMHGLGTPEDLELFIRYLDEKKIIV
jgi:NDP-sugar pyrophosphorylase family protein